MSFHDAHLYLLAKEREDVSFARAFIRSTDSHTRFPLWVPLLRSYQRLYFRGRTNQAKSRGTFKAAYGGQLKDGATTGAGAGGDEEAEEADESAQVGSGDGNSQ